MENCCWANVYAAGVGFGVFQSVRYPCTFLCFTHSKFCFLHGLDQCRPLPWGCFRRCLVRPFRYHFVAAKKGAILSSLVDGSFLFLVFGEIFRTEKISVRGSLAPSWRHSQGKHLAPPVRILLSSSSSLTFHNGFRGYKTLCYVANCNKQYTTPYYFLTIYHPKLVLNNIPP